MTTPSSKITLGNAPVSWGVYGPKNPPVPWATFMDACARAGYRGTELGPYGYFPTDAAVLKKELAARNLQLGSSYVGIQLENAAKRPESVKTALEVGRLLASQGVKEVMIAADDNDARQAIAGRIPKDGSRGWSNAEWKEAVETLHAIGRALRTELSMGVIVHHHVGTMIETPSEVARLLADTDKELVNLLLDTGHYTYGGGDPVELLKTHGDRVTYVHLKDVRKDELQNVRTTDIHMNDAWKRGVFCPLGEGVVDFPRLVEGLRSRGYSGWAIVEQDVIPDENGKLNPDPFVAAKASREYLASKVGLS